MLDGQVVTVTGGCGYLGQTFVEAIVAAGGRAVIADQDQAKAEALAEKVNAGGGEKRAVACRMDITSREDVLATIAAAQAAFGRVDALVNSAYPRTALYGKKLEEVTYASFCANVDLHLGGYFLATQQYAIRFAAQGSGNVVNLSSIYGVVPPRFEIYAGTPMTMPVEYAAIKAGIQQLSRYFAKYYQGKGVRFNVLSPGGILANQPQAFLEKYNALCMTKGMLERDDMVGGLLFLLSAHSRYVNGQNLIVDDGFSL